MPPDSIIPGHLEMSRLPLQDMPALPVWDDVLSNKLLVVLAVILMILFAGQAFRLLPPLLYSVGRPRGSAGLEYNLGLSAMRNHIALVCLLPFALICSRYGLYAPDFMQEVPPQWQSAAVIAVFLGFTAFRALCYLIIVNRRFGKETSSAARRCAYSFFILLTFAMLVLVGIFSIAGGVSARAARLVLLTVIGLSFLMSGVRSAQILAQHCNGLAAFLYLCGLELMPATLLVLSAVVL